VLLVGGASLRMGQDKLRMRLPDGSLLAERPAIALARTCATLLAAHRRDQAAFVPDGFDSVTDAEPGGGPLAGIVAALAAARTPWILVVGGDMPDLRPDFLRSFMDLAERDLQRALVLSRGRRLEPMPLAIPLRLQGEVLQRFHCGERAVRRAVPANRLCMVEPSELELGAGVRPWLSLNTPEDWLEYTGAEAAVRA
jgi:molybdopterin-guanine dinucleotide biosynthesis protein A